MFDLGLLIATAGIIALIVTNLLVPLVRYLCQQLDILDYPSERKLQKAPVPHLGGLTVFAGIAIGVLAALSLGAWGEMSPLDRGRFLPLVLGTCIVFLIGVADDMIPVTPRKKLIVQIAAAWLVVQGGWDIDLLRSPFSETPIALEGWTGDLLSILWIVGVTNAVNFMDGLDGLASGIVAIISTSFLVYALLDMNVLTLIVMGATVGACLGFLRHNWAPAQIFLGDSGSLLLGFLLAVCSIGFKTAATVAILVPILALGLPLMDMALVVMGRFHSNRGDSLAKFRGMFEPDRTHLHQYLLNFNVSRRQVVVFLYAVVTVFCTGGILISFLAKSSWAPWLLGVEFVSILLMRTLGWSRATRLRKEQVQSGPLKHSGASPSAQ